MWVQGNDYTTLRDTLVRRSKDETKYELGETGYYGGPAPDAEKLGYPRGVVPSVPTHADLPVSSTCRARMTLAKMSFAVAVQTNGAGESLCLAM
jgi:hypothetical protein